LSKDAQFSAQSLLSAFWRAAIVLALVSTLATCARAQQHCDLLLHGGRVIDPANHLDGIRDVAITNGHIAAIAEHVEGSACQRVVDVSGLLVTPGLIDIHAHVYAGTGESNSYAGDNSVYPDGFTFRTGVTTVADAGGSGWKNFYDFKERIIDRSQTRVLVFLNIVGDGMRGTRYEQDTALMDAQKAGEEALKYPGLIVGIKTAHYMAPDWIAVEQAVKAGSIAHIPVMVDFGDFRPERPYQQLVLEKLRPGDISTHMYLSWVPLLDEHGKLLPYLAQARKRGVIFDVGHGGGSFLFRQAVPAIQQGWVPDSISTDLHISSMNAGMKDMLNVMSKFLNMGLSLNDVIRMSTSNPAHEIQRPDLGTLTVGSEADVAVFNIEHGKFGFVDTFGARMDGAERLQCEMTLRAGKVVWDLNGRTRDDWKTLGNYRAQGSPNWDGTLSSDVAKRTH